MTFFLVDSITALHARTLTHSLAHTHSRSFIHNTCIAMLIATISVFCTCTCTLYLYVCVCVCEYTNAFATQKYEKKLKWNKNMLMLTTLQNTSWFNVKFIFFLLYELRHRYTGNIFGICLAIKFVCFQLTDSFISKIKTITNNLTIKDYNNSNNYSEMEIKCSKY